MKLRAPTVGFRPTHDQVVVHVDSLEKTRGGIVIRDPAEDVPQMGKIIAVGRGSRDKFGKFIPIGVKAGDKVLFGRRSGGQFKVAGQELRIITAGDIVRVLEDPRKSVRNRPLEGRPGTHGGPRKPRR